MRLACQSINALTTAPAGYHDGLRVAPFLIALAPALTGAQTGDPATRTLAGGVKTPALVIEAPPELDAARNRLESFDRAPLAGIVRTVGLVEAGPPITVVLAGEDSETARRVNPWTAGYAIGDAGQIVLFPSRSPRYPHDTLEDVLRHEVAHVLISRAAGGRPVARWFHEGLAVAVERPWGLEDRSRLAWELVMGPRLTLRDIDALFEGGQGAQSRGYSLSAAVVRDIIREHGPAAPSDILRQVNTGATLEEAVATVAGRPIGAVEDAFWDRHRLWTAWMPLVTSDSVLWLAVTALAALAVWRRRRRRAQVRRQWEEEERAAAERDGNGQT